MGYLSFHACHVVDNFPWVQWVVLYVWMDSLGHVCFPRNQTDMLHLMWMPGVGPCSAACSYGEPRHQGKDDVGDRTATSGLKTAPEISKRS
jgi:hypothetical protein